MKKILTICCFWLLVFAGTGVAQYTDLSEYSDHTFFYFSTPSISPAPVIAGRSGAMASLEFTVRDSVRDVFINPAKYYGNSSVFISPSAANQSLYAERRMINPYRHETDFTTYSIPIGGVYTFDSFYMGGLFSYSTFNRNETMTSNSGDSSMLMNHTVDEDVSGAQFEIFSGFEMSDRVLFAASYQRQNYNRYGLSTNRIHQAVFDFSSTHTFNAGKLGAFFRTTSGETNLLATLYRNRFEDEITNFIGNYWQHLTGYQLRAEHLHPVSQSLAVGVLISFENRSFLSRTEEIHFNDHRNRLRTFQFGTGIHRITSGSEYGIEIIYQPIRSEVTYQQPFSDPEGFYSFDQSLESSRVILRGGLDQHIWSRLRVQGGLSYTFSSDKELNEQTLTSVPDENIFNEGVRNDMIHSWNRKLLSAGLTYSLRQVIINYYTEVFFNDPDSDDPRYINQILLQYKF